MAVRIIGENDFNSMKNLPVEFYADDCAFCRMMEPVLDKASEKVGCDIYKIDVETERELSNRFGIRSIPTFIIFKNGVPVKRKSGMMTVSEVVSMLGETSD